MRAVDARYRTIPRGSAARARRPLRGRLRRAEHRHPSSGRVLACSRAGPAISAPTRSAPSSGSTERRSPKQPEPHARRRCGEAPSRAHLRLVLQRHRRPVPEAEHGVRRRAASVIGFRTTTSSCMAGTTGRSGAATRRARYLAMSRRLARCVRSAALPVLLVVAVATSGWLYLVQPGPSRARASTRAAARRALAPCVRLAALVRRGLDGGRGAARPLRALGSHRAARLPRCSSPSAIGMYAYLQTGVSIAVVRQIPARSAFDVAARLSAVYLPAAIVGLGAAALAVGRRRRARACRRGVRSWRSAALLNLLHAVLPGENDGSRPQLDARRRRAVRPRSRRRRRRRAARCCAWARSAAASGLAGRSGGRCALGDSARACTDSTTARWRRR